MPPLFGASLLADALAVSSWLGVAHAAKRPGEATAAAPMALAVRKLRREI